MPDEPAELPEVREDSERLRYAFLLSASFAIVLWLVKIFESVTGFDAVEYGVYPGKLSGLLGILTAPFIHSSPAHLRLQHAAHCHSRHRRALRLPQVGAHRDPCAFPRHRTGRLAVRPRVLPRRSERLGLRHDVLRLHHQACSVGTVAPSAWLWWCSSSTAGWSGACFLAIRRSPTSRTCAVRSSALPWRSCSGGSIRHHRPRDTAGKKRPTNEPRLTGLRTTVGTDNRSSRQVFRPGGFQRE